MANSHVAKGTTTTRNTENERGSTASSSSRGGSSRPSTTKASGIVPPKKTARTSTTGLSVRSEETQLKSNNTTQRTTRTTTTATTSTSTTTTRAGYMSQTASGRARKMASSSTTSDTYSNRSQARTGGRQQQEQMKRGTSFRKTPTASGSSTTTSSSRTKQQKRASSPMLPSERRPPLSNPGRRFTPPNTESDSLRKLFEKDQQQPEQILPAPASSPGTSTTTLFEAFKLSPVKKPQVSKDMEIMEVVEDFTLEEVDDDDDDEEDDEDDDDEEENELDLSFRSDIEGTDISYAYVEQKIKVATEKIESKWKERFNLQAKEYEDLLQREKEISTSRFMEQKEKIICETRHLLQEEKEKEKEQEEKVKLKQQQEILIKQLEIEVYTLKEQLYQQKHLLDQQEEQRAMSAHSFWEKTTDLAKTNRILMDEKHFFYQTNMTLEKTLKHVNEQWNTTKKDNKMYEQKIFEMEKEKQLKTNSIQILEEKFVSEKTRRKQFQVQMEQLSAENNALYAQMVTLQAAGDARVEEMKVKYEQRHQILMGEMKMVQRQNQVLMRERTQVPATGNIMSLSRTASSSFSSSSCFAVQVEEELNENLKALTDELLIVRQELTQKTEFINELEKKIHENELVRRKMHNTIQELRGNVRVHARVRPFLRSDGERHDDAMAALLCDTFGSTISTNRDKSHTFMFDKVYNPCDKQEDIFNDVSDLIHSAMDGYHVCIFAYGQTGSGKTHTMQGSGKAQLRGIIPRSISLIISSCDKFREQGWNYSLEVSFYEIYNETIRDLLEDPSRSCSSSNSSNSDQKYHIRTDRYTGKNYVENLITKQINFTKAEEEVEIIMNMAANNRSVNKTDMNEHSSRSHSIFLLTLRGINEIQNTEVEGSLSLVDLAGSERVGRSGAIGERLKEAQAINKSLSALADVFRAIAQKSSHVPYRNSKLTYVLQPALSGDGKTLMMVNLSPTEASIDESICSLRFAQQVSQCELGAPVRQIKARTPSIASTIGATMNSTSSSTPASRSNSSSRRRPRNSSSGRRN